MLKRAITNKKNREWCGEVAQSAAMPEAYRDEMGTGTRTGTGGEVAIKKKAEGRSPRPGESKVRDSCDLDG